MTLPKITTIDPDGQRAIPDGDNRGRYGFGRSAHGADPDAMYHFHGAQDAISAVQEYIEEIAEDFNEEPLSSPPNPQKASTS